MNKFSKLNNKSNKNNKRYKECKYKIKNQKVINLSQIKLKNKFKNINSKINN